METKKKIFTFKKINRKSKKKKATSPQTSQDPSNFLPNFKCPEPKKKAVKISRSLTFNNRETPQFKPIEPVIFFNKEEESELLNTYQIQLDNYLAYGYTYTMDHYLKQLLLTSSSHKHQLQTKYDILLILKNMLKTFMMNELELIFLSYFLEENKWDYLFCFPQAKNLGNLPENLQNSNVEKSIEYKALLLYLFNSCFAIKQMFHHPNEVLVFQAFMNKICADFLQEYENWRSNAFISECLTFNPWILNRVYEINSISWKGIQSNYEQIQSFDSMVNMILEISPPYLYEKTETSKKTDFESSPFTSDLKIEFKEFEKSHLQKSNTLQKENPFGVENFHREDSFRRMNSFGFTRFLADDFMKIESNLSLPRADSFRSNAGINSNFFNIMNNNDSNEKRSQEFCQNKKPG